MKKFITLLLIVLSAFSYRSAAQGTLTCNADFTVQFINGNTVKFVPVQPGDSFNTYHNWSFGDNSYAGNVTSPTHTYSAPGTYVVGHSIVRYVNGATCSDTINKTVVIQGTTVCNLQSYFTWHVDSTSWNTVHFQNQSQPYEASDSIRWNFGDGTIINGLVGTLSTPSHVYANAGTYNVCIRVKKNNNTTGTPCVSEICKTVAVTAPNPCNLTAAFTWYTDSLNVISIHFLNQSQPFDPTDSIRWNFGDGTIINGLVGTLSAPVHVYANAGTYNVCIRIKKNNNTSSTPCVRELCKTVTVTIPCNFTANFSSHPDSLHPQRILFTNLTAPIGTADSVRWTFGDGTVLNGIQGNPAVANPVHEYAQPGTYTVCLRVKKNGNAAGTTPCVREICKTVVVTSPCNFQVNFSMHRDSLIPRKVYFTNLTVTTSANAIVKWSFGDGTYATTWNADHTYAQPGTYVVCLTVQLSATCIRDKCDTIVIPATPSCLEISKFKYEKSPVDNQLYKFTPDYLSNDIVYTWTFGDGTGSHDPIVLHHYAQPGTYIACLTAWRGPNCASTTCKEIKVLPQINCDSIHVSYTYQKDPFVPNKIYFYANANYTILDQTWTITRLSPATTPPVILHQNNPVYVFHDTGYYNVCLKAVMLGGCIKEYCHVIHIEQVVNSTCELQAYPNPASNVVNVNVTLTQPGMIDAYIYNAMNMLVKEKHQAGITGNNLVSININDLTPGLYNIKLVYGGKTCYARFTKL
ncbi:PKD domain-containing protein [Ferruginibacter sp.]